MGDLQTWRDKTRKTMQQARIQSADLLSRMQKYDAAEAANKLALMEATRREKERLKMKAKNRIKAHHEAIDGSTRCIRDIEDAMTRLEDVASKLTHERYARFADLQVCLRRLECREKRPDPEQFRDYLQASLESEKQMLNAIRKELLERESELKSRVEALYELRRELSYDTGVRRLQVEHENKNIKASVSLPALASAQARESPSARDSPKESTMVKEPTMGKEPTGGAAMEEPASPTSGDAAPPLPSEESHQVTGNQPLIEKAEKIIEEVDNMCTRSEEVIRRSQKDSRFMTKSVNACLARRTAELAAIKRNLEDHVADVNYAIGQAERNIEKYYKRLNPRDSSKKAKVDSANEVLEDLKRTKADLVTDLHHKIHALDIDNTCRRITPQVASEQKRRQSAPNGGSGKLGSSASSPNLARLPSTGSLGSPPKELDQGQEGEFLGDENPELTGSATPSGGRGNTKFSDVEPAPAQAVQ
mmetsp:Transcript_64026/g.152697  ORF Transcript_64026/g.152697 Transcript_64026/m.152697 type:complete len:476 (-) Transcript_64026:75-1502(-)|eukprot:CAMPEP_0178417470 /NCGR_PEP_ID=MMETSP0689_2-20121128/24590_1 /TAXON_ID=160604 /ORGANISM="Amphidinium massartii, Strain CS-259" /LENGTH=475 /DNA_ID=CAMNT_0020038835 /DNA_START=109 /DNA_END=1536 /DNA_ORIENTATION=-